MLTKARISFIKSLGNKKERIASGLFVAEGFKLVSELIGSELNVKEIYAREDIIDKLPFFDNITVATEKEMERISHLKTPSDVLALVQMPLHRFDESNLQAELVLALDDIQDPGNLGTIIRLADWFGIRDIFCTPSTADCFNPKVVQATMGAVSRVRLHYGDLVSFLHNAREKEIPVYGTFLEGGNIYELPLSANGIIVMGNEGKGVSDPVSNLVTDKIFIPPYPPAGSACESLNVAVATAVICSEFRRRL